MTSDEQPEFVDLEALDVGPMLRYARTATFAPNWKSVLLADATVGLTIMVLGIVGLRWSGFVGWPLIGVGAVYLFMVMRRALQWRWLRRRAGLD